MLILSAAPLEKNLIKYTNNTFKAEWNQNSVIPNLNASVKKNLMTMGFSALFALYTYFLSLDCSHTNTQHVWGC